MRSQGFASFVGVTLAVATLFSGRSTLPSSAAGHFGEPGAALSVGIAPSRASAPSPSGLVETRSFWSASLGRQMEYRIYLPPGYADQPQRRYPTVYLLHGMAATDAQWEKLGVATTADRLIASGAVGPMVIVMPEGENAYWVDHATDGQKWGEYTAVDLVGDVDANFRSVAEGHARAIGGISMGAHGALQLALNHPGEFAAVGAHSLVLRGFGSAASYFGDAAQFAERDPIQLVAAKGAAGCSFKLWIDIGESDPWTALAGQFNAELDSLGVAHAWHVWPGGHSDEYWTTHMEDYLRFYDGALNGRPLSAKPS